MFRKLMSLRTPALRMMETQSNAVKNLIVEPLSSRELICVRGEEVSPFLQGLITNDMTIFNEDSSNNMSIYTMFLNKMGRVICDSIIYKPNDRNTFLIECDQGISDDLRRHLRLHRVHRKIDVESLHKEYKPWVIFSNEDVSSAVDDINVPNDVFSTTDPRGKFLGLRIIMRPEKTWSDLGKVISKKKDFTVQTPSQNVNYRFFRYSNGVGEGIIDIPPGKCFPLEANCDFLNGISFHKGCYIGQELTARTYHMGVIRKRLMPIRLTATPTSKVSTIQSLGGLKVGTLRGVCANHALGLLRVEKVLNTKDLLIDGDQCSVYKPSWWPQEIQTRTSFWKAN